MAQWSSRQGQGSPLWAARGVEETADLQSEGPGAGSVGGSVLPYPRTGRVLSGGPAAPVFGNGAHVTDIPKLGQVNDARPCRCRVTC